MSRQVEKPFYFNPPWNILFELNRIRKIKPWDINISFLLNSFLEEMEKSGQIDFRASGVAVDSSSTIYLMKSKLLLKLEEPPAPPPKVQPDFLPPPLSLPFRYELTSTTIHHLLQVLDEVLKGEHVFALKPRVEPVLPPPSEILPPVDIYMMEIEKQMGKLHQLLLRLSKESMPVLFSKVVAGFKQLEAIKTFIVLLFLAQKGDVNLWQDPEELNDIYITLGGGPAFERPAVGVV